MELCNHTPDALPPQLVAAIINRVKNVVYIINVSGLRFCRNVHEVSARIVYTLAFKALYTANYMD